VGHRVERQANRLLAPLLGIAPMPLVRMPTGPFEPRDKVPPVAARADGRAAVWIDDLHRTTPSGR
jgi:hypothetical protein